jgi:hypothetical protein
VLGSMVLLLLAPIAASIAVWLRHNDPGVIGVGAGADSSLSQAET